MIRFGEKRERMKKGLLPERQGQNLGLPAVCVPLSLGSGEGAMVMPVVTFLAERLLMTGPAWPRTKTPCREFGATRAWSSFTHYPSLQNGDEGANTPVS